MATKMYINKSGTLVVDVDVVEGWLLNAAEQAEGYGAKDAADAFKYLATQWTGNINTIVQEGMKTV